ncbi:MAG: ribonuclease HII [Actinomycetota bacterium]|nr:ribonuclease HII [Actinomycetota bacterium]
MSPASPPRPKRQGAPNWRLVRELFAEGCTFVGGLDEVGRGAWAGPVTVGIVVVEAGCLRKAPRGVRDSKLLAERARESLYDPLVSWCPAAATGEASPQECDELGMTAAQKLAASRALARLSVQPEILIVDGKWDYTGHPGARAVIGADATCFPVAAASVLAKVTRDRQMIAHAPSWPAYGFARNKGYASSEHRAAVAVHGMSPLHRRSWSVGYGAPEHAEAAAALEGDGEVAPVERLVQPADVLAGEPGRVFPVPRL